MNTLKEHVLIYDKNCPLCNLYTSAFIEANMIDKNGRADYCTMDFSTIPTLDMPRAKDEIALINTKTGHVTYGIDSLFKILSNTWPILKYLFSLSIFKQAMSKFYSFISYNRKVISPEKTFEGQMSCTPSFNLRYRWAYIILSWMFTSFVLSQFVFRLSPVAPSTNFFREWLICGGQIIFQSAVVAFMRRDRLIHYLGNLMTVSNIGALLLLSLLLIPESFLQPELYILLFAAVVAFMLYEHVRRTKILELSGWTSVSWVAYRLGVSAIVLV